MTDNSDSDRSWGQTALAGRITESRAGLADTDAELVTRAADLATVAHDGQRRRSGEPYVFHPAEVAVMARRLGMGASAVAAAWLHDVVEDTDITLADIRERFGDDVATLVDGLTKVDGLHFDTDEAQQADQMRRLLLHLAADPRAVVVKVLDRLHNMRTVAALDRRRQERMARETLAVFAPLAHRLGFSVVRAELEDCAFEVLWPERFRELSDELEQNAPERDRLLAAAISRVESLLSQAGISATITGRAKHLFAIAEKMERSGIPLDQLHDLLGIRVIVDDQTRCYQALGIIHCSDEFQPVPRTFKDYIAVPRVGVYSSLHTVVVGPAGRRFEVQIRSSAMHAAAERGPAAHWRYKAGTETHSRDAGGGDWVDMLLAGLDTAPDLAQLRVELDANEVFTFTPSGDMVRLPSGASVIDFAFAIHTEVGGRAIGARVNGVESSLTALLSHGDRVEIVTAANAHPQPEWLDVAVTGRARSKIRTALRGSDAELASSGKARLAGWGVPEPQWSALAEQLGFAGSADELAVAVAERRVARRAVQDVPPSSLTVRIGIVAVDRPGLLSAVTAAITAAGGDILTSHSYTRGGRAHEEYTVTLAGTVCTAVEQAIGETDGVLRVSVTPTSKFGS
jgi:GTP diphosphokinase / guanosine-3',5'-bis(diphosphate) 3'-diphosphatase